MKLLIILTGSILFFKALVFINKPYESHLAENETSCEPVLNPNSTESGYFLCGKSD